MATKKIEIPTTDPLDELVEDFRANLSMSWDRSDAVRRHFEATGETPTVRNVLKRIVSDLAPTRENIITFRGERHRSFYIWKATHVRYWTPEREEALVFGGINEGFIVPPGVALCDTVGWVNVDGRVVLETFELGGEYYLIAMLRN